MEIRGNGSFPNISEVVNDADVFGKSQNVFVVIWGPFEQKKLQVERAVPFWYTLLISTSLS